MEAYISSPPLDQATYIKSPALEGLMPEGQ